MLSYKLRWKSVDGALSPIQIIDPTEIIIYDNTISLIKYMMQTQNFKYNKDYFYVEVCKNIKNEPIQIVCSSFEPWFTLINI